MQIRIDELDARNLAFSIREHIQENLLVTIPLKDIVVFIKHDNMLVIERITGSFLYRPCPGLLGFVSAKPNISRVWRYNEIPNPPLKH